MSLHIDNMETKGAYDRFMIFYRSLVLYRACVYLGIAIETNNWSALTGLAA